MTSVVLADDQELVLTGLRMVLEARGLRVLGTASNGREAVSLAARMHPDVAVLDIRMPVMDGIEATRLIMASGSTTRVLVLTTYDLDSYVYAALCAGASGFLLKATKPDRLVDGIRMVAAGEALLAPELTRRLIEQHTRRPPPYEGLPSELRALTEREVEIFELIARGRTNDEIAERLVITGATVKTHINRILTKLGLQSRVQMVVLGYESGLIIPGDRNRSD